MARTKAGSGRLQPYTFTPAATDGTLQEPSPLIIASTTIPDEPIQSTLYIKQDPEVLEAAQILMSMYRSGTDAAAVRKDSQLAIEDSSVSAHDDYGSNMKLAPPEHGEDEDLEVLDSPTRQFQERTAKRRTTRGRAVVTKKPPTRTRSAQYPATSRDKDREYFEHPVLTAIHDSPAKKSRRGQRASYVKQSDEGDTTEMDPSASSDGDEEDVFKPRHQVRKYLEDPVLTRIHNPPAKESRRAQAVGLVKDSTHDDTTEIDSPTPSDDDGGDDGDYIPAHYRKAPNLRHGSSSSTLVTKPSRNRRPTGYVTPLGPTTSPLSRSSDSSQSPTILAQDSPTKSLSVAPRTPSRAPALDHVKPSSVTSLQKFLSKARRTQGHRRTESLESSGFFEKVRRAHVALHEESGEDEDEDAGVDADDGVDERDFVKDEDGEGDVDIRPDELAPGVKDEYDSTRREEGEISNDDDDDGAGVSPPQWHRGVRARELDTSMVLDY
ncbi:hypothetical protein LTR70_001815 [Exophiala xenobiotica]|uniref:Uncharacterized protein n=1 Tax=Lithohypha guttulata TaxID=1690604 RepID=A0ABR0KM93_9EURO|nr:hypothetical protein LTR24_000991 [Lithohypha guttulata]KAK5327073.1 hypothetical protein LTR70_001815 [Exophiala xenobiotica]